MERKGTLLSVRSDVRVLDATIRDGGLVNDFFFPDEFIRDLYQTNIKAGVDYMEFGYKADKSMFDPDAFGKWKFCELCIPGSSADTITMPPVTPVYAKVDIGSAATLTPTCFIAARDLTPATEAPIAASTATFSFGAHSEYISCLY